MNVIFNFHLEVNYYFSNCTPKQTTEGKACNHISSITIDNLMKEKEKCR